MKIKLSKSQWEQIGKTAGWLKKAQNMSTTFLETPEDILWLFQTHLKEFYLPSLNWSRHIKSAIITGNEDCPQKIELFTTTSPNYKQKRYKTFILKPEDLSYKEITAGS